jgi:hypothetical protein
MFDPRAREIGARSKNSRAASQKIVMRKTAAVENIGRRIQVSRSEEARTHLTKVRCAWGRFLNMGGRF